MPIQCINELRKLLTSIWNDVDAKGRCWGKKRNGDNPLRGSHITFFQGDEMVTIFPEGNDFKMLEYKISKQTKLGDRVREHLENQVKFI